MGVGQGRRQGKRLGLQDHLGGRKRWHEWTEAGPAGPADALVLGKEGLRRMPPRPLA